MLAQTGAGQHSYSLMRTLLATRQRMATSAALAGLFLLLTGCEKTDISVYQVPKESPWKLPAGWKEREAGGMRAARFAAPSPGKDDLDVSIFPIRGFGGSPTEILNIWRQQLKLEPYTPESAPTQSVKTAIGSVDAELYDMTSTEPVLKDDGKGRSIVAFARHDGTLWFIKMTGDDAGVGLQKDSFLSFIKGVNLNTIPAPTMPAMGGPGSGENPHGSGDGQTRGGSEEGHDHAAHPEWQVPPGWTEQAPGRFLNAKFVVTGAGDAKVEINVSVSAGEGGGVGANINRWRGQLGLPTWDDAALEKNVTTFDAVGAKATLVDFQGTDARTGKAARLIGVIVPAAGQTWFYKMMGDEQLADREKPALIKMVASAKHPNG